MIGRCVPDSCLSRYRLTKSACFWLTTNRLHVVRHCLRHKNSATEMNNNIATTTQQTFKRRLTVWRWEVSSFMVNYTTEQTSSSNSTSGGGPQSLYKQASPTGLRVCDTNSLPSNGVVLPFYQSYLSLSLPISLFPFFSLSPLV